MIEVIYAESETGKVVKVDNREPLDDEIVFVTVNDIDYTVDSILEEFHIDDLNKVLKQKVYLKPIDL